MIPGEISLDVTLENVDRDPTSEEGSIVEGPVFPAIVATASLLCTTASANGVTRWAY